MAAMAASRRSRPRGSTFAALVLCCHPLPTLLVTFFAAAYALRVGASSSTAVWVALATLTGQFTVGWVNDLVDADRDRAAGRRDKPLATGQISQDTVSAATLVASLLTLVLSLHLGLRAGLAHLLAIGAAQAYNLRLKGTPWSGVPYVLAFGLLPVVVTAAVWNLGNGTDGAWPPLVHVIAAALLGADAHAGNTVGDAEADAATGVRGLPQILGPQASLTATGGLVAAAALLLAAAAVFGDLGGSDLAGLVVLLGAAGAGAAVAVLQPGVQGGRTAWRLTLGAVTLVVLGFLLTA